MLVLARPCGNDTEHAQAVLADVLGVHSRPRDWTALEQYCLDSSAAVGDGNFGWLRFGFSTGGLTWSFMHSFFTQNK